MKIFKKWINGEATPKEDFIIFLIGSVPTITILIIDHIVNHIK